MGPQQGAETGRVDERHVGHPHRDVGPAGREQELDGGVELAHRGHVELATQLEDLTRHPVSCRVGGTDRRSRQIPVGSSWQHRARSRAPRNRSAHSVRSDHDLRGNGRADHPCVGWPHGPGERRSAGARMAFPAPSEPDGPRPRCGGLAAPSQLRRDRPVQAQPRADPRARRQPRRPAARAQHTAPRGRVRARYSQSPLDDPSLEFARASVTRMLDAHHPYPGIAIDRHWNVLVANEAAFAITAGLPDSVLGPPLNVYRISLHPDGLAARTHDFAEWAVYQLRQLRRSIVLTGDRELEELYDEVRTYPNVAALDERDHEWFDDQPPLLLPFRIDIGGKELSFFTTLTAFATPLDVTLEELAIELFFPADAETDALLTSGDFG